MDSIKKSKIGENEQKRVKNDDFSVKFVAIFSKIQKSLYDF